MHKISWVPLLGLKLELQQLAATHSEHFLEPANLELPLLQLVLLHCQSEHTLRQPRVLPPIQKPVDQLHVVLVKVLALQL